MKKIIYLLTFFAVIVVFTMFNNQTKYSFGCVQAYSTIEVAKEKIDDIVTNLKNLTPKMPNFLTHETEHIIDDVDWINQNPEFPTGCESVSCVMALNYMGVDITTAQFVDNYLAQGNKPYWNNGELYACDPHEAFVGDPRDAGSYGCYNTVIKDSLDLLFENINDYTASISNRFSLNKICKKYINNDIPVLIWGTIDMEEGYESTQWIIEDTGKSFQWLASLHCMLLVGYDEDFYYFNDPLVGAYTKYDKKSVETAFGYMGKQSLVIKNV